MKNYKTLNTILAGAVALGSCSHVKNIYHYDGKIGREEVQFYEQKRPDFEDVNILKIRRPDGTEITMTDHDDDLQVDGVTIVKDGTVLNYQNDHIGKKFIQEAQKQFDTYLNGIHEKSIEVLTHATGDETSAKPAKKNTLIPLE